MESSAPVTLTQAEIEAAAALLGNRQEVGTGNGNGNEGEPRREEQGRPDTRMETSWFPQMRWPDGTKLSPLRGEEIPPIYLIVTLGRS